MRVLITGSQGFIGKNLLCALEQCEDLEIDTFCKVDDISLLESKVKKADFIFHLAGVNRPKSSKEFYEGNGELTQCMSQILIDNQCKTPVLMTSSVQAEQDNDYGRSKLQGEGALRVYAEKMEASVFIYRLPNVFGKWSQPNYNTVIATWCHQLTRGLGVQVNDEKHILNLVYIDDVTRCFVSHLNNDECSDSDYYHVSPVYQKTLGEIFGLLMQFKENRKTLCLPSVGQGFERALYATYLSFLSTDQFSYDLNGFRDERGTFYEFLKTIDSGQFSISTTAPGITRGNHFHHTKNEKFLVVKGNASIKHRHAHSGEVIEYIVSDEKMTVVEMIPGYTHNITNIGDEEMVLLIWANEQFDVQNPDTYFLKV